MMGGLLGIFSLFLLAGVFLFLAFSLEGGSYGLVGGVPLDR